MAAQTIMSGHFLQRSHFALIQRRWTVCGDSAGEVALIGGNALSARRVALRQAFASSLAASSQISSTIRLEYGIAKPPTTPPHIEGAVLAYGQVNEDKFSNLSQSRSSQFMADQAVDLISSPDISARQFKWLPSSRYSAKSLRSDFTKRFRTFFGWIRNHAWHSTPRANNAGFFGGKSSFNAVTHQLSGSRHRISFVNGIYRALRFVVAAHGCSILPAGWA